MSDTLAMPGTVHEMESKYEELIATMLQHEKTGNYKMAESFRIESEKLKKDLEKQKVTDVGQRQKQEKKALRKTLKEELKSFTEEWDARIDELKAQGEALEKELLERHAEELQAEREKIDASIPLIGKQSAVLLDLRKMEENSAHQRNYVEAHRIQQQVQSIEKVEKDAYQKMRTEKIEGLIAQERARQSIELAALRKRTQGTLNEAQMKRTEDEARLTLRHNNLTKEQNDFSKKQELLAKGELKSRINLVSPQKSLIRFNSHSNLPKPGKSAKEVPLSKVDQHEETAVKLSGKETNPSSPAQDEHIEKMKPTETVEQD